MDPTERFSDRVADYVCYRPDYPTEILEHLEKTGLLFPRARVADVGAGTGIFTRLLLGRGYDVVAVEPNDEMRAAASASMPEQASIRLIGAQAEATTLPDGSIDLVTAAQALHWFEADAARAEFRRITRPPHRLAAVWNRRDTTSSDFLREYEQLLQDRGIGYTALMEGRDELELGMKRYFGENGYEMFSAPHVVRHDWDGLVGRLLSSSYGPKPNHPDHERVMRRLRAIFDAHSSAGEIEVLYAARVYYGHLAACAPTP